MKYAARKRADSACSDADNDYSQAEAELAKLHRQYRILECNRKAYLQDSTNILRKQRSHIDTLEKDNAEVDIDLSLALSRDNASKDNSNVLSLRKFVVMFEDSIQDRYRDLGGCNVDMLRHKSTNKQNRIMENRLYKATVSFNSTLTKNADLRDQIEHLRRERALYDSLYRKLMKEQDEVKREMGDVIEESTLAYDSRDEAHSKMTALRERSEKDQANYNIEVKELRRIIDHEQNLKEFMNVKAQERTELKAIEAAKRKKRADELSHPSSYAEEMEQFEAAMGRIKTIVKEADLDLMVHHFIQKEDANFALFNYVNELNSEIESFHEEIKRINEDMVVFKNQGLRKYAAVNKELTVTEAELKKTKKKLDLIKSSITGICHRIGCDDSSILEKLGSSSGINDDNAVSYLGLVEQLANELILIKTYQRSKEAACKGDSNQPPQNAKQAGSITAARLRPVSVASIRILPPPIEQTNEEDTDEDSDSASIDDTQLMTPEAIKSLATKMIQRKEKKKEKVNPKLNEDTNKGRESLKQ
ncbi:Coiled-coil domain-containing protein 63 [Holothuria leucospilota]|uniref:Coiled-coil domain-containing protein 63 n=1 Tax=Holothuria leucospilota TaxID=206669 RepID=A0A9Q1CFB3_HOLLE|nr:Coiled-coil domain-containing protein 63 [Holothuria leucospilota]